MRLQTILLPTEEICSEPSLYCHAEGAKTDWNGYLNLFYIEKWKAYTTLRTLRLVLRLKGWSAIRLMHDQELLRELPLNAGETEEHRFELPYDEYESGVFWFSLTAAAEERTVSGRYEGEAELCHAVNIAADICTFRREAFVVKNLRSVEGFMEKREEIEAAAHLRVFIVDNGNTLEKHPEIQELLARSPGAAGEEFISVIANRNVGGTGGFTRGMIEALDRKEKEGLTHVLLMDDDAVFDPDIFVRLYGFLSSLKEAHRNITVGGVLLREDYPWIMQAGGEWYGNFRGWNDHPLYDLRSFENSTADFMCEAGAGGKTLYSGWWCCCYSLNVVREDNLPVPMFLHHDDISYGLQNAEHGIVFLNGVNAWHKGFGMSFAGVNEYYDVRNPLITASLFEPAVPRYKVIRKLWAAITVMLAEYRYAEGMLAYRGLKDFLRGPEWLCHTDAEVLHGELRAYIGKHFPLRPYEELDDAEFGESKRQIKMAMERFDFAEVIRSEKSIQLKKAWIRLISFNGWLLPAKRGPVAVAATDSLLRAFRRKKIVLFEPGSGKAAIARRDYRQLKKFIRIYFRSALLILKYYPRASAQYRQQYKEVSSAAAWRRYLRIQ